MSDLTRTPTLGIDRQMFLAWSYERSLVDGLSALSAAAVREFDRHGKLSPAPALEDALHWHRSGRQRLVLTASMASLLVATRAPAITASQIPLPYEAFVLEVPGEFTSMPGIGPLQMFVSRRAERIQILGFRRESARRILTEISLRYDGDILLAVFRNDQYVHETSSVPWEREGVRYAVNAALYVSAHRESAVAPKNGRREPSSYAVVSPPQDVQVTREFREHAKSLIANRSLADRKAALLHIVRGHWRREPHTSSVRWIRPYQRGDGRIGSIVAKTTKLT